MTIFFKPGTISQNLDRKKKKETKWLRLNLTDLLCAIQYARKQYFSSILLPELLCSSFRYQFSTFCLSVIQLHLLCSSFSK